MQLGAISARLVKTETPQFISRKSFIWSLIRFLFSLSFAAIFSSLLLLLPCKSSLFY
jgi:hypothetical protein